MEKLLVILLLILVCKGEGGEFPYENNNVLLIDCGIKSNISYEYNNQTWLADSFFLDSGETALLASRNDDVPPFLLTLRHFPQHHHLNCYDLPVTNGQKFLFRAGFYYANYDTKSEAPVFDLKLGGQLWATVNSSSTKRPIFHELIYTPVYGNISVCLRGIKDGGDPFISSLESTLLYHYNNASHNIYAYMENATTYHLITRINFGTYGTVIPPWSHYQDECEEWLNRYWMPQHMSGYRNIEFEANFDATCPGSFHENQPPNSLLNTAITPNNASQSIHIPIVFPTYDPQLAYIVLYFYQNLNQSETLNASRYMDIYVDGVLMGNVRLDKHACAQVMTLYPLTVQATTNVTISPANGTVLPPLINGMEVFTATQITEQASYGFKISSSLLLVLIFQFFLVFFVFD